MERDLDDTVIRPLRPLPQDAAEDAGDTIVRRRPLTGPVAEPAAREPRSPREAPVSGPRYGFRVNTSELIGLDRPAYIGRNPSPPRVPDGVRPRLVRVPSARGEVSGTHLELRQQGQVVIATDLKSTNGTRVSIPGSAPVRLRQNESIVVGPGSVVELGDDNVIEILTVRRAHPPGRIPRQTPGADHP